MGEPVIVKKIKPYPINVKIQGTNTILAGEVLLLTLAGLHLRCSSMQFKLMQRLKIQFNLPVKGSEIQANLKVVRVFFSHEIQPDGQKKMVQLAEAHFVDISSTAREEIMAFLQAIKAPLW